MTETQNRFRIMILEDTEVPEVYLVLQEGMGKDEAYEVIEMYREQGKTDLKIEEYYPDAHRLGRNAELH